MTNYFLQYITNKDRENRLQLLHKIQQNEFSVEKYFKVSDIEESGDKRLLHRSMSHWDKEGLLPEDNNGKWRRFSFVEFVWLMIVKELREFGYPLPAIKTLKESLLLASTAGQFIDFLSLIYNGEQTQKEKKRSTSYTMTDLKQGSDNLQPTAKQKKVIQKTLKGLPVCLGFYLADIIINRQQIHLIIYKNGEHVVWELAYLLDRTLPHSTILEQHHISIPLHNIVKQFIQDEKLNFIVPKIELLTEEELEVLYEIRKGNLSELTVRFDNRNKISLIERKQQFTKIDVEARYIDHIMKGGYHQINYTTSNGKIVKFERITKKKLY